MDSAPLRSKKKFVTSTLFNAPPIVTVTPTLAVAVKSDTISRVVHAPNANTDATYAQVQTVVMNANRDTISINLPRNAASAQ